MRIDGPVLCVVGARPNLLKVAPILRAFAAHAPAIPARLVHTGQHYDHALDGQFFDVLGLPAPDAHLGVGSGTHAVQTAQAMERFEPVLDAARAGAVLVVGDVNSSLACALVAAKKGVPVLHVEAGLRSGDMAMPEEINRLVTDSISDWFFVTEPSGVAHLQREGKPDEAIHYVGHVMVDNVLYQADKLTRTDTSGFETSAFKTQATANGGRYGVITLHRPSNVDSAAMMARIGGALREIANEIPLVFPVHPRTRANLQKFGIDLGPRITLIGPQPYMAFLHLWKDAALVLTDSGGLQEETTALGVPCITIRENTERPVTVDEGSNVLAGTDPAVIVAEARKVLAGQGKAGRRPHLWDGQAAQRTVEVLARYLNGA